MANKKLELLEQRAKLIADARALAESGTADAETNARVEQMIKEAQAIKDRVDQLDRISTTASDEDAARQFRTDVETGARGARAVETQALAAFQQGGYDALRDATMRAALDGLQVRAMGNWIRHGAGALLSEERAALNITDTTRGGVFQPPPVFTDRLFKAVDDVTFIEALCRAAGNVFEVSEQQAFEGISLDTDLGDFDWTTELATGAEDDALKFGSRKLMGYPAAKRVKFSKTLAENPRFDIVGFVIQRLAYRIGLTKEKSYLLGNGTNKPLGMFVASNYGIPTSRDVSTGMAATALTAVGLRNIRGSVKQQYRRAPGCGWLFHRDAVTQISTLRDESGGAGTGQFMWQPSMQVGQPDILDGFPIYESEYVPNTFTTGLYVGMFGAIGQAYAIANSSRVGLQRLIELYAESNQDGLIARIAGDGQPVMAEAVTRIKLA